MRPAKFKSLAENEADRNRQASNEMFDELKAKADAKRAAGDFKSGYDKIEWLRKEWAKICGQTFVPRKTPSTDGRPAAGMTANEDTEESADDQMGRVGRAKPEVLPPTHKEQAEAKA